MSKTIRGTITEIHVGGVYRGPIYIRVTAGGGPGRIILLNFVYQVAGLKVGDLVEVEVEEHLLLGLIARKIHKLDA